MFGPPKLLMLKVLSLITATSAHWVLELHVLCIDPLFLLENPFSYLLVLNPVFRPKMATEIVLFSNCPLFSQSLLALWGGSSTLCVLSVRCQFIFIANRSLLLG